ncbi:prolyl oligopeptidase family serine peptidase [Ramlibacter sp. MMS24-I3-19]|uniref:S9 family peptidase n=1 Tax=Ramlibacter sp. MMS24-I3-19 TaxID=3416606 RepID=UPI003D075840
MAHDRSSGDRPGTTALTRRRFNQGLGALGVGLTVRANAQDAPVPLEQFFQNPAFGEPRFSPDGNSLAVGVAAKNGRVQLVVIDVARLSAKVVASFTDSDVSMYDWVNDDRLVGGVTEGDTAPGDMRFGSALFAVDKDGDNYRRLWTAIGAYAGTPRKRDTDDIFVEGAERTPAGELHHTVLFRLNTRTGHFTRLKGPDFVRDWVLDQDDEPRVAVTVSDGKRSVLHRDPRTGEWRALDTRGVYEYAGFEPYAFTPDGTLLVTSRQEGDTTRLHRYDLQANRVADAIVSVQGYDFQGSLVFSQQRLLGVHYVGDAISTVWLDERLKGIQQKVDALLPNTINLLAVPLRGQRSTVSVHAHSDRDPGTLYLFDTASGELTLLGKRMRDIDPRRMGKVDLVRYKARDGLEIPAWLTLPAGGGKNLPMVVLVHGGPYVRGRSWRWDPHAHFLASRGYAVLEPEFRGSTGFGFRHFRAGWKQWGLKMQDDIADGTRWAIAEGIADPKRICIAGASYGGYATLMGLVNDPDLYKCGIDWVGVTDIEMLSTVSWSDLSDVYERYGMPILVGDRAKDAEQLRRTSPLHQAARIRQPLLLAYGGRDRRVPIVHGTEFRDAVQKTNPDVEWIEYRLEGHGWMHVPNRIDFWTRVEKFLARHLGPHAG